MTFYSTYHSDAEDYMSFILNLENVMQSLWMIVLTHSDRVMHIYVCEIYKYW